MKVRYCPRWRECRAERETSGNWVTLSLLHYSWGLWETVVRPITGSAKVLVRELKVKSQVPLPAWPLRRPDQGTHSRTLPLPPQQNATPSPQSSSMDPLNCNYSRARVPTDTQRSTTKSVRARFIHLTTISVHTLGLRYTWQSPLVYFRVLLLFVPQFAFPYMNWG